MLNKSITCHWYLETEKSASGNEVFRKVRNGKDFVYFGILEDNGERLIMTKQEVLNNMYTCLNAYTSDGKTLKVKHSNDAYIIRNFARIFKAYNYFPIQSVETPLRSVETDESFGSKAHTVETLDMIECYSYNKRVCVVDKVKWTIEFTCIDGDLTQTTLNHLRSFLKYVDYPSWIYPNLNREKARLIPLQEEISMGKLYELLRYGGVINADRYK